MVNLWLINDQTRAWLRGVLGTDVDHVMPMKGSTSSAVFLVKPRQRSAGPGERFVLRLLTNKSWLAREGDLAEHEAAALLAADDLGIPAPRLIAYADEGQTEHPAVLMTFLDGDILLRPPDQDAWLAALARMLAEVHQRDVPDLAWAYKSWTEPSASAAAAASTAQWGRAAYLVAEGPPDAPTVLIHRDYHPANVLWQDDGISGVVDWINACRGPAGVDVAHCRLNLALMYGPEAAERFLAAYCDAARAFEYQPYWDLDCIVGCGPTPGYYPPWREFGLPRIPDETLKARLDAHLSSVLARR
jgi:Ser/Thr protein kinase RdoA (MazF antagonist)